MKKLLFIIFSIISLSAFGQVNLPDGVHVLNPKPADDRTHYSTRVLAWAGVPSSRRYAGLTVFIDSANAEYWWKYGDLTNAGLVIKTGGGTDPTAIHQSDNTATTDFAFDDPTGGTYFYNIGASTPLAGVQIGAQDPSADPDADNFVNASFVPSTGVTWNTQDSFHNITSRFQMGQGGATLTTLGDIELSSSSVIIPNPTIADTTGFVLVRRSSDGKILKRHASSISGGSGWATSGSTTVTTPKIVGVPTFDNIIFDSATSVNRMQFKTKQSSIGNYFLTVKNNNYGHPKHDHVMNLGYNTNGSGGRQSSNDGAFWLSWESDFNGNTDHDYEFHLEATDTLGSANVRVLSTNIAKDLSVATWFWHLTNQEWRIMDSDDSYFKVQDGEASIFSTTGDQTTLLYGNGSYDTQCYIDAEGNYNVASQSQPDNTGRAAITGYNESTTISGSNTNAYRLNINNSKSSSSTWAGAAFQLNGSDKVYIGSAGSGYSNPSLANSFFIYNNAGNATNFLASSSYNFDNNTVITGSLVVTKGILTTQSTQAGGRNLTSADNGTTITTSNNSPITLTIVSGLPVGFHCTIVQGDTGSVVVSPGSGVTGFGSGTTTSQGDAVDVYHFGTSGENYKLKLY